MSTIEIGVYEPFFGIYVGVRTLNVHDPEQCLNEYCCIHNPSNHHMRDWEQRWRADRHMMERMCPHEQGHPDPDDINPNHVHGCDLCCVSN